MENTKRLSVEFRMQLPLNYKNKFATEIVQSTLPVLLVDDWLRSIRGCFFASPFEHLILAEENFCCFTFGEKYRVGRWKDPKRINAEINSGCPVFGDEATCVAEVVWSFLG